MLLHEMSILDCANDAERNRHSAEIEEILNIISSIPDYRCLLNIRIIRKGIEEEMLACHLHHVPEVYEYEDFTNGADFEIGDSNILTLTMYGNPAEIDGRLQLSRTVCHILPYIGDIRNLDTVEFVDISPFFVSFKLYPGSTEAWGN